MKTNRDKESELPIYSIDGVDFTVDVRRGVLAQKDDPGNWVAFNDIRGEGEGYRVFYDKITKKLEPDVSDHSNLAWIDIPQMAVLDPKKMSELYHVPVASLVGKKDAELFFNNPLVDQRLKGILPTVNLAGDHFFVDVQAMELRYEKDSLKTISLNKLYLNKEGTGYELFYNTAKKQPAEIHPGIMRYPKNIVMLEIPIELKLDPIGMARKHGLDDLALLRRYPMQADVRADVKELKQTPVAALIGRNRKENQEKRQGEKEGKGLKR